MSLLSSYYSPHLSYLFPPLVGLQAALLHPAFRHDCRYRIVRELLMLPAVVLALRFPADHQVQPLRYSIMINTVIGYWSVHGACLALHFGLSKGPFYRLGGTVKDKGVVSEPNGEAEADTVAPFELLKYVLSMVFNLRGIGWSWQLPSRILPLRPIQPVGSLCRELLLTAVLLHAISVAAAALCMPAFLLDRPEDSWTYWTGSKPAAPLAPVIPYISTVAYGLFSWAGLELSAIQFFAFVAIGKVALRLVLPTSVAPEPVRSSDYVPMGSRPWARTSLADFWARGWHAALRRDFVFCGSYPVASLLSPFGRTAARCGAVIGAFAMSGFLHDYALTVAAGRIHTSSLVFFLSQAAGIIAEETFTRISGRRVGGALGWIWTIGFLAWTGWTMSASWMESGMADGLMLPKEWGWRQVLVPGAVADVVIPPAA